MASSALSHALDDLLDLVHEEIGDRDLSDSEDALFGNADALLDEYRDSSGEDAYRLGQHVRGQLARVVQHVNEEHPELVGSAEMMHAVDLLAQPHLPAVETREPVLTPNEPGPLAEAPVDASTVATPKETHEDSFEEAKEDMKEKAEVAKESVEAKVKGAKAKKENK